ncbi:hypothetical protein ACFX10_025540 [Malus domestica]
MPNSSSPPRVHSQQSLLKYSVFFISGNILANKWHQRKSISYHQGRKQEYLISYFFPVFSFTLALTCKTRRKKAISRNLKSNFRSGTDCPEPLPGCLPGIALECSSPLRSSALKDHLNAKVAFHSCIGGKYCKTLK